MGLLFSPSETSRVLPQLERLLHPLSLPSIRLHIILITSDIPLADDRVALTLDCRPIKFRGVGVDL